MILDYLKYWCLIYSPFFRLVHVTDFAGRIDALLRLKLVTDHWPHVVLPQKPFQELGKLQKFAIVGVLKPGFNGNTIVHLIAKRVWRVVY